MIIFPQPLRNIHGQLPHLWSFYVLESTRTVTLSGYFRETWTPGVAVGIKEFDIMRFRTGCSGLLVDEVIVLEPNVIIILLPCIPCPETKICLISAGSSCVGRFVKSTYSTCNIVKTK